MANRLAALAVALADEIAEATDAAAGLTGAAPAALVALQESAAGESVDRLRLMVGLTPSGAVRLVDRLVEAGLVRRRPGRDARSVSVALTTRGRRVAARVLTARAAAVRAALAPLNDRDRTAVSRLSDLVLAELTRRRLDRRHDGDEPRGGALCRLCDFAACGRPAGACPVASTAAQSTDGRSTGQTRTGGGARTAR